MMAKNEPRRSREQGFVVILEVGDGLGPICYGTFRTFKSAEGFAKWLDRRAYVLPISPPDDAIISTATQTTGDK